MKNHLDSFGYRSPIAGTAPMVLIIDDDDAIRALAQWVAQRAGYQALTARDGPEGLECFRRQAGMIGLVLLDLTMPRMTGAEVIMALRNMNARVPVVLITGYGEEAVRDEERLGSVAVLQKPFTPDDLRRVLARYLGSSVASPVNNAVAG